MPYDAIFLVRALFEQRVEYVKVKKDDEVELLVKVTIDYKVTRN